MKQITTALPDAELLSALADGQLAISECASVLRACGQNPLMLEKWNAYQLIGDVLRSPTLGVVGADMSFVEGIRHRLAVETVPADVKAQSGPVIEVPDLQSPEQIALSPGKLQPAANDGDFRWKLVAGFASLAAVGAIAWSNFGSLSRNDAPQMASTVSGEQMVVASPQGPIVRDARLEELLAAHRQLGSTSALQMPSGFLRNAAFETPQDGGR